MQPLARGNTANAYVPASQYLLSDQRHHDGMIDVMVGGITRRNILKREPRDKTHNSRIARFEYSVRLLVHFVKLVHEAIDNHLRGIKHWDSTRLGAHAMKIIAT